MTITSLKNMRWKSFHARVCLLDTANPDNVPRGHYCNFAYLNFALVLVKLSSGSGYKKEVVEAKIKVVINGFGRFGRNFLRCWHGRKDSPLDVVAVNNTGGVKQASHLLKYDSILGIFDADVKPDGDDAISVDGKVIKVVTNRNPANLPWKDLGIVIEGTGVFVDKEGAEQGSKLKQEQRRC